MFKKGRWKTTLAGLVALAGQIIGIKNPALGNTVTTIGAAAVGVLAADGKPAPKDSTISKP